MVSDYNRMKINRLQCSSTKKKSNAAGTAKIPLLQYYLLLLMIRNAIRKAWYQIIIKKHGRLFGLTKFVVSFMKEYHTNKKTVSEDIYVLNFNCA